MTCRTYPREIHQVRQLAAGSRVPAGLGGAPLEGLEKQAIIDTLAKTNGNREQAAKILSISERTLYRKILNVPVPRFRKKY
ncbi:MAG: helix-turn-helix domain-containing protein [Planctomycetota bacterium]